MADLTSERDPVELLATEFIERCRRGEHPSIDEYLAKHPQWAEQIRELFPTIAAVEQLKVRKEQVTNGAASLGAARIERLGDFRIIREIGRGGMGIVYEAEQESLGRRVAVKVLPRQLLLESKQLQRFQREAQTAARLHHTNIVPVFGVGHHDGYHYYVMQYIQGVGLNDVLAQLGQLVGGEPIEGQIESAARREPATGTAGASVAACALVDGRFCRAGDSGPLAAGPVPFEPSGGGTRSPGTPGPGPATVADTQAFQHHEVTTVETRSEPAEEPTVPAPGPAEARTLGLPYWHSVARIGLQVADALRYAHAQGTLHRDIKPANLLLDSGGVVWVADFGLAKALEDDSVSRTGDVAGTLPYMAPEQFQGRLDARCDIYSLGLTLYELLTLRPAYADTNRSNLIRKIAHQEPTRPRKLRPEIPRDLETIVLKAIAREPAHRYSSAGALAADLQCYLEDRPIRARRVGVLERLWRWSRRNRALASLAATALLLLVVVAVVSSVAYVQAKKANIRVQDALTGESKQREKAEATTGLALEALDKIFDEFAPNRMVGSSDISLEDSEGDEIEVPIQPVLSKQAAALLEHMLVFYERLAEQSDDDARMHERVAEANRRVGEIYQRLGNYQEAKASYLRAIEQYTALAGQAGVAGDYQTEIARIHNELGKVYRQLQEPQQEYASYQEALSLLQSSGADSSTAPQARYELARTYYQLGRRGPGSAAPGPPPSPGGPLRLGRGAPGRFPGQPGRGDAGPGPPPAPGGPPQARPGPPGPFSGQRGLGMGPGQPGRGMGPGRPRNDTMHPRRGPMGNREPMGPGEPMGNQRYLDKAVSILEDLAGEYPKVPDYRHLLACCYREMTPRRPGFGPPPDFESLNKAIAILEQLASDFPDVADYRYDLSESYAMVNLRGPAWGRQTLEAAEPRIRQALALSERLVAEHPNVPDYAASQVHIQLKLAEVLRRTGKPDDAEACLRKALALQSSLAARFPEASSYKVWTVIVQESLAALLREQGNLDEAKSLTETSIGTLRGLLDAGPRVPHVRRLLVHNHMKLAEVLKQMDQPELAERETLRAQELRAEMGPGSP